MLDLNRFSEKLKNLKSENFLIFNYCLKITTDLINVINFGKIISNLDENLKNVISNLRKFSKIFKILRKLKIFRKIQNIFEHFIEIF